MEAFKELLWFWYIYENRTASETHHLIHQYLTSLSSSSSNSGISIPLLPSLRTLQRWFQKWDFIKYNQCQFSSTLPTRLWVLFYEMGLNDSEILGFLHKEGHSISILSAGSSSRFGDSSFSTFFVYFRISQNTIHEY